MNSEYSPELRKDLLDDFYAECDELLTAIRENLALLEHNLETGKIDTGVIETLFRNVHSLKGISAIVGLRPAEELAHLAEDTLRGLSKLEITLTAPLLDTLLVAAQRLEMIVTSHRLQKPLPDIQDVSEKLRRRNPGAKRPTGSRKKSDPIPADPETPKLDPAQIARDRGLQAWICSFAPTAELDQRGINLNAVRERLARIGEILSATPSVRANGSIVFEFLVALRDKPGDLATWEAEGLHFRPAPGAAKTEQPVPRPPRNETDHPEALSLTPSHIVRVDLARLEDLMRITGEMVIHRFRLEDRLDQSGMNQGSLKEISLALSRSLREMRQAITRVRLVPIAEIFTRMPFVVRDLTRESGKKVRVLLEGHHTEVDKYLVERLKEPLLHLVRNAFSHGVETPKERTAAGKPKEATILLQATSEGESVLIQVRDDGRGIDVRAIAAQARKLGLSVPARLELPDVLKILCTPGFSTRDEADLASGRGVGMAVVANTVRELGGTLALESWPGKGTVFTLRMPLTLSIAAALIVAVGEQSCAVPQGYVDEIAQVQANEVRRINETQVVPYRGGLLPLIPLREMFGIEPEQTQSLTFVVLRSERGATGLVVDRVRSQREIVIRPLSDPLLRVPGISGATELGDGRPILILDPVAITQGVVRPPENADDTTRLEQPTQHAS
jgi:two-component system chemotaxis sensor kinase CheA